MSDAVLRLSLPPVRRLLPGLAAGALSAGLAVALLATSAWLITRASEHPPILFLSMAVVGVRAFALGRGVFRYLERLASHDAAFEQLGELRAGVFRRLLPLAPAGLARTGRGDLLTSLVRDVDDLQDLPLRVVQPLVSALVVASLSVVGVFILLPAAGVALAVCLALAALLGTLVDSAITARSDRRLADLRGLLADRTLELVENVDVLTAFDAVDARLARLATVERMLARASLRRSVGIGAQAAIASLLAGAATVATLMLGAPSLDTLGSPAFAVIVLVPFAVFEVFAVLPAALGTLRRVRASAARVASAVPLDVPAQIPVADGITRAATAPNLSSAAPLCGEDGSTASPIAPDEGIDVRASAAAHPLDSMIELDSMGANWPGAGHPAVSDVTLRLAPGDVVHLVGPSGSGKSTVANALVRFLEYSGSYRIGGIEARSLSIDAVRATVGLCEQRPWLFDESIRQNLLFARDSATDADLLAVLDRVGLLGWALDRGGLDARVGERGALVSGGQAQRIALARALLAEFPVLVLDEPTANVDRDLGELLLRELLGAATSARRAVLLISHAPVPAGLVTATVVLNRW